MRPVKSPMHQITLTIDADSLNITRQLAEDRDTSVSKLVRDLMREEWQRHNKESFVARA